MFTQTEETQEQEEGEETPEAGDEKVSFLFFFLKEGKKEIFLGQQTIMSFTLI